MEQELDEKFPGMYKIDKTLDVEQSIAQPRVPVLTARLKSSVCQCRKSLSYRLDASSFEVPNLEFASCSQCSINVMAMVSHIPLRALIIRINPNIS